MAKSPQTFKEFCAAYSVSKTTFNKWLAPIRQKAGIRPRQRNFTPLQIKIIIEHLGEV